MNDIIDFRDIDDVKICKGDEVLVTYNFYGNSSSHLKRAKIIRFTPAACFFEFKDEKIWPKEGKMFQGQVSLRILVLKGDFVEYSKTKDLMKNNNKKENNNEEGK
jgi:hypothetical protein